MLNLVKSDNNHVRNIQRAVGYFILLLFVLLTLATCESKHVIYTPKGYDISKAQKTELGQKLDEISGIFWENDDVMLANDDETGKIFFINLKDKKDFSYHALSFGKKNDYEDIVKADTAIYLLISDGEIVKVTGYHDEDSVQSTVVGSLKGGNNEFETIYYDKEINSIILLCKACHKEKDKIRTAFRYDIATQVLSDTPYYEINIDDIKKVLKDNRVEFRPSAAAIHPIEKKLYILSSVGKLLVITDRSGNVEQAIPLSPSMFPQPEGITFASNGDMYISNEVNTGERATLLKFKYQP
ncbi:MAG: SdiA-regulated domain-containing protein [Chitinophagaceae bacterium]